MKEQKTRYFGAIVTVPLYLLGILAVTTQAAQVDDCVNSYEDLTDTSIRTPYLCPGTRGFCVADYAHCDLLDAECTDAAKPFFCQTSECKAHPKECCTEDTFYCPHAKTCVATEAQCCSLDPLTPYFCTAQNKCVASNLDCCEDLAGLTSSSNKLMDCSYEKKCAISTSFKYCFKFKNECDPNGMFPYKCMQDGLCKQKEEDCASPRVCPPGYTQCADRSCIPGLGNLSKCQSLNTCRGTVRGQGSALLYARCPDGVTCVTDYANCPTEVSCGDQGKIVCPDGSCQSTANECIQPPTCKDIEKPWLCQGLDSRLCVAKSTDCPYVKNDIVCPKGLLKCENGQCMESCNITQITEGIMTNSSQQDCKALGKFYCPNSGECAATYEQCPDQTYCPYVSDYTYSPNNVLCGGGAQVCVSNVSECSASNCSSKLFYPSISDSLKPFSDFRMENVRTCPDGRCMHGDCMTPFSCSPGYIKLGGFGEFCASDYHDIGHNAMKLTIQLRANICPSGQIKCISGQCRDAYDDCPQEITCPLLQPVKCRDGNCVQFKTQCKRVDEAVEANLKTCLSKNSLLCPSDLVSCTDSIQHCPVKSTCPFGLIKCSNNSCVSSKSMCPASVCDPESDTPFFCENANQCIDDLSNCPTLDTCPQETPVRCSHIHGSACQRTAKDCHLSSQDTEEMSDETQIKLQTDNQNCDSGFVYCKGGCKKYPCPEWEACPVEGDTQCWNGLCVSDETHCPLKSNGCPFYTPIKCPYSEATCVVKQEDCTFQGSDSEAKLLKSSWCNTKSNGSAPIACTVGNCAATEEACPAEFPAICQEYLYPNTIKSEIKTHLPGTDESQCLIPQCPLVAPHKCANGLCVEQAKHCPQAQIPLQFYLECYNVSMRLQKDVKVPCGDQSCVSRSDQCPPIYKCELNPIKKIRCSNDGSCVEKSEDCYKQPRAGRRCTVGQKLNLYAHVCTTGLCAASSADCLNEVGCPGDRPVRCESSGVCMKTGTICLDDRQRMEDMAIVATGNTFCQSKGLGHTCMSTNSYSNMMYCSSSIDGCIDAQTLCSQDTPVNCFNTSCGIRINMCEQGTSSPSNLFRSIYTKTNSPSVPLKKSHPMLGRSWKEASDHSLCPPSRPFRCSTTDRVACRELPYTSYTSLYDHACSTSVQTVAQVYQANRCLNSETPVSCADGSCARAKDECQSCPYFCTKLGMCVGGTHECDLFTSFDTVECRNARTALTNTENEVVPLIDQAMQEAKIAELKVVKIAACQKYENYFQVCPPGLPFRCITNGICVQSSIECMFVDRIRQRNGVYAQNFVGSLVDSTCSPLMPIRCGAGQCAKTYQECISSEVNLEGDQKEAFLNPVAWGSELQNLITAKICQVICQDGTCRDRQENCPVIQACNSPSQPHRCNSGFCAKDHATCVTLFGDEIEESSRSLTQPTATCGTGPAPEYMKYIRCEDGICRPANENNGTYTNTCLNYFGCSRELPYQCQNGSCATSLASCPTVIHSCDDDKILCKNRKCVDSPDECQANQSISTALQLEISFNPYKDNTFTFAYAQNKPIGRIVIPSNAIHVDVDKFETDKQIERDIYQHIIVTPVPEVELDKVTNEIQSAATAYLNKFYNLSDGTLSRADSLLMPAIQLSSRIFHDHTELVTGDISKDARVEYFLDSSSMPTGLTKSSDICLALVADSKWQCVANVFNTTEDGWVSFPFSKGGQYALIVSPDPTLISASALCGFWCDYQQWFYIGGSAVIFIVITVVVLVSCLGAKNKYPIQIQPRGRTEEEMLKGTKAEPDNKLTADQAAAAGVLNKMGGMLGGKGKAKADQSDDSDHDNLRIGFEQKQDLKSKFGEQERDSLTGQLLNGKKPAVNFGQERAKPYVAPVQSRPDAPRTDRKALLSASMAKQKEEDETTQAKLFQSGTNEQVPEEESDEVDQEEYGAEDDDSGQMPAQQHHQANENSIEMPEDEEDDYDSEQLGDAEQQMRELCHEHSVDYSEDIRSSSADETRSQIKTNTPSVVSMAVSAKKGRISQISNGGSMMGFGQYKADTTQYTQSAFDGRSAGFYHGDETQKLVQQEFAQYKEDQGSSMKKSSDPRLNLYGGIDKHVNKDFVQNQRSFGPQGQSQTSRPVNKHGKSASDANSPVKGQEQNYYQSHIRKEDTNIGGFFVPSSRSNNGVRDFNMESAHNPSQQKPQSHKESGYKHPETGSDQEDEFYNNDYGLEEDEEEEEESEDSYGHQEEQKPMNGGYKKH